MNITKKTYYGVGILAAAFTVLGGVLLIFGTYAALLYNMATALAGCVFLGVASKQRGEKDFQTMNVVATALLVGSLIPGLSAKICGALAWPVFAWLYYRKSEKESTVHTVAFLVLLCGAAQLIFSFLPMERLFAAVMSIVIASSQLVLCWQLFAAENQNA